MPRRCTICHGLTEHRMTIDARLRAGESLSVIAEDYQVSQDCVARHATNHLRRATKSPVTLAERLTDLAEKADALYDHALATGNARVAIDSLGKLVTVTETMSRLQQIAVASPFEGLTTKEKVDRIWSDQELQLAIIDRIVTEVGIGKTRLEDGEQFITH